MGNKVNPAVKSANKRAATRRRFQAKIDRKQRRIDQLNWYVDQLNIGMCIEWQVEPTPRRINIMRDLIDDDKYDFLRDERGDIENEDEDDEIDDRHDWQFDDQQVGHYEIYGPDSLTPEY